MPRVPTVQRLDYPSESTRQRAVSIGVHSRPFVVQLNGAAQEAADSGLRFVASTLVSAAMLLEFTKMNGAGNDFVLADNRDRNISLTREQVVHLCHRQRG